MFIGSAKTAATTGIVVTIVIIAIAIFLLAIPVIALVVVVVWRKCCQNRSK